MTVGGKLVTVLTCTRDTDMANVTFLSSTPLVNDITCCSIDSFNIPLSKWYIGCMHGFMPQWPSTRRIEPSEILLISQCHRASAAYYAGPPCTWVKLLVVNKILGTHLPFNLCRKIKLHTPGRSRQQSRRVPRDDAEQRMWFECKIMWRIWKVADVRLQKAKKTVVRCKKWSSSPKSIRPADVV